MTSLRARPLAPPRGGTAPADKAQLANGEPCFLAPLAHEAARRHLEEYPDERARYGDAGLDWCAHDIQWILAWAALEVDGNEGLLSAQLGWLSGLLAARDYPTERLRRAVEIAADVVADAHGTAADSLVATLRAAAPAVTSASA